MNAKPAKPHTASDPASDSGELSKVFEAVARYFGLLAETTRLKILHTICHEERSVSAIVAATGATQTNVSRHLSLMHQAGVVSRRREGSTVYYRVLDPEFGEMCKTVCVRIAGRMEASDTLKRELLDFAAQPLRPREPAETVAAVGAAGSGR